ncbi:type I-E CRISPR-associated protein Cse2/CasB [Streptomyces hygroscopicus]|uniref:type I-E CRISPR-associated protein Cse2/CasB n=1 Tax=Streptomyces hygroscopicus TaxID=1912 RepID=UPI003A0FC96C
MSPAGGSPVRVAARRPGSRLAASGGNARRPQPLAREGGRCFVDAQAAGRGLVRATSADRADTAPHLPALAQRLREIVVLLRREDISLDYSMLAEQLYRWQLPGGRQIVRRAWGRSFHKSWNASTRSHMPVTTPEHVGWGCLERATAAEGKIEALMAKLAAERVLTTATIRFTGSSARSADTDQRPSAATWGIWANPVNASRAGDPIHPAAVTSAAQARAQAAGRGASRRAGLGASSVRAAVTRNGT